MVLSPVLVCRTTKMILLMTKEHKVDERWDMHLHAPDPSCALHADSRVIRSVTSARHVQLHEAVHFRQTYLQGAARLCLPVTVTTETYEREGGGTFTPSQNVLLFTYGAVC